jgi:Carboxypeptidase regulatory-like domain
MPLILALALLTIFRMKAQAYRPPPMRQFVLHATLAMSLLAGAGCHPKPTIVSISSAAVGGTIAGVVYGPTDRSLSDRTITVVNVDTGERFQTATGENGGYSVRVPPGTYRVEVQLRDGEKLAEENATILLKNSDREVGRNVDINAGRQ